METRVGGEAEGAANSRINVAFNSSGERARLLSVDECEALISWVETHPSRWESLAARGRNLDFEIADYVRGTARTSIRARR